MISKIKLLSSMLTFVCFFANAQCTLPTLSPSPTCSNSGGLTGSISSISTDSYIRSGVTVSGSNMTFSNNVTLIVCGTLSISNVNTFGSNVTIIVSETGTLNFTGDVQLQNGITISNYGTVNVSTGRFLTQNGSTFINATASAALDVDGTFRMNNNSNQFINFSNSVSINTFSVNDGNENSILMANGADINAGSYQNNDEPGVVCVEEDGCASINIGTVGNQNDIITNDSDLYVCTINGTFNGSEGATIVPCPTSCVIEQPVKIAVFKAYEENQSVTLEWKTTFEIAFSHFEVEKSENGVDFQTIGTVKGKGGMILTQYDFCDTQLSSEPIVYYRLKQVDLDGTFEYSKVLAVHLSDNMLQVQLVIAPNPVKNKLLKIEFQHLNNEELYSISILNLQSQEVYSRQINGIELSLLKELSLENLPLGVYYLMLSSKDVKLTERFLITQ